MKLAAGNPLARSRDLVWLIVVLCMIAITSFGRPAAKANATTWIPVDSYGGHWIRPDKTMLDLVENGDKLEGTMDFQGWAETVHLQLDGTGGAAGTMERTDKANSKTTICQMTLRPEGQGFVLAVTGTDGKLDLPKDFSESFVYRRHAAGFTYADATKCPKPSSEPNFNGRWIRGDGAVKVFYQEGDELEGSCESNSWYHKLHIHLTDATHGEGTMERTHKGSHKTTVCKMRIVWEGQGFRLAMVGTDGTYDLPANYSEEFAYRRCQ